ncbi:MAG: hypothetical protein NTZ94_14860 [Verrucomicrobia bacterium]|jgi:hypothetical protein|nr:hypothetical protein [Verrucomicrobiota bacterium]
MKPTKTTTTEIPQPAADLFASLDTLRVVPEGTDGALVQQLLNHVPVRKPSKEWFFRIHPTYSLDALIVELKEEGDTLLVAPSLQGYLLDEKCVCHRTLRLGINRQGNVFVWPVRRPLEGRKDGWATTSCDAVALAEVNWTRMQADMNLGGYKLAVAKVEGEPKWPEQDFPEILRLAFKGAVVDSLDHPTLKRLRGDI